MSRAGPSRKNPFYTWLLVAGVVLLLDQASKWAALKHLQEGEALYVAPFFNWMLAFNTGAAFSFLADAGGWQRWFFFALSLFISGGILLTLKNHPNETRACLALSLVMGGALGNAVDRLTLGAVIDFIQWHAAGHYWPTFNLADSAVSLGAALLVWAQCFPGKATPRGPERER